MRRSRRIPVRRSRRIPVRPNSGIRRHLPRRPPSIQPRPRSGRRRHRAPARATSRPACSRSCGRAGRRTCLQAASRSVAPPTTTSSSPTCWPHATTPRWCRRRAAPRSVDNRSINGTFVNGARIESAMLRDGDVVTIGNVDLVFAGRHAGPPQRHRGRDPDRWPRSARRHVDHRGQQDTAGQHLADRAAGHVDGRHRAVGCRQVDVRATGGRLHPSDIRHGQLRRPQHPRRIRLPAKQDRHGPAGRRGARPAHRQAGPDVRRGAATAAGHHEGRPRTGRRRRCSKSSR